MNDMGVAQEILRQLGGRRLSVMTGAKNFTAIGRGLQFSLPIGKARKVKVDLTPADTYDVSFMTLTGKLKSKVEGVHCDKLHDTISQGTGLALAI